MKTQLVNFERDTESDGILDAIYSRRAVRQYLSKRVSERHIRAVIDAAIQAPSAMNNQPWAFIVIQNPRLLNQISREAKQEIFRSPEWGRSRSHVPVDDPEFNIFYGATTLIVICAKTEAGFFPFGDCYLAAQNLMLSAHQLGLATCPIGLARDVLRERTWRSELSIPADYEPVLPIIVGYGAGTTPPTPRAPAKFISWHRNT